MTKEEIREFFSYVQPIVSSCTGFMRTEGYMIHTPGVVAFMNSEETTCGIVHIPVIFNVYMTAIIGEFLSMKEPENQNLEDLYFVGWNIKGQHLQSYVNQMDGIDAKCRCIYSEPNCLNIPGFEDAVASSNIGFVNVSDGLVNYRVPASKAIVPMTKTDTTSLKIYDCAYADYPNIKTIRYTLFKKKLKLTVDIYSNIVIV